MLNKLSILQAKRTLTLGSARGSRAGEGDSPSRTFLGDGVTRTFDDEFAKDCFGGPPKPARESRALPRIFPRTIIITFCVLFAIGLSAAPIEQPRLRQIRAVIQAQQEAWNRGDIDGFMNGYARGSRQSGSDSTIFVSEDSVTRGWQIVRDRYKKKYSDREKMGTLVFSDLEITPLGNEAAIALGRWKPKRAKDEPHGRFTLIFRRTPDGWRIVHDHTSAAAPPR